MASPARAGCAGWVRDQGALSGLVDRAPACILLSGAKNVSPSIQGALEIADREKRNRSLGMSEVRTLIVDDSSAMRKIVERAPRQADLDLRAVHEAGDGTEGLDLLRVKPVDLILCDINMQSMDAHEFLRQLRLQSLAPGVPVVTTAAESSEEHPKMAIQAGSQGYIRKPFTAERVKERILPLVNAA
jgi:two-component system chemotaxis response regulator CheY